MLYVYSTADPDTVYTAPGINVVDDFSGIAIGNPSGGSELIIIDNCRISGFSHCAVKGPFQWWIKNSYFDDVGTDWHDHHLYSTGNHEPGKEAIIENNYFGRTTGAAIHLYSDPSYHIVRNNIISGAGKVGVLLSGKNHKVLNNTIFNSYWGLMFFREECHDNVVKNNLLYGNGDSDFAIDTAGDVGSYPRNNVTGNNLLGSSRACGGCVDKTSAGGDNYDLYDDPPNIINQTNPFISSSPTLWTDLRLAEGSAAIDTGENLGPSHGDAMDPADPTWPPSTTTQDSHGSGWEIGALVYSTTPPDSIPPSVPSGLLATTISTSQINLAWEGSTDNVGVAGYRVYRNGKQIATTSNISYQDTGLRPGTLYTYRVAACDAVGNISAKSTSVTKKTQPSPSSKFLIGDRVQVIELVNVRSEPKASGAVLGTRPKGALGTVVGGPWYWNQRWWWEIDFDSGLDGWVKQRKLKGT